MELIMNQKFENETIVFDGYNFIGCTFKNCIIFVTSTDFEFDRCSFFDTNFYADPSLPIFQISHRLSQSTYDDIACFWDDVYKKGLIRPAPHTVAK
ncbi:hypothetical protein BG53_13065 [Paenibacillus darwinianus]|uniref:Uncharacterized protein n=1 Tax=Paenibacillus darwinianus TaxID=1380763 RepID=A0A9W5S319_9BACL|nr:hypothetical protein [Paenibacillus darwinianus]EXX89514.1 hypothetical protein CH50_01255 [Paenibacillus darwinianus]EXX90722.1 hypothetical protein BG53_13065 [Paenibacillus darwinianus]EXX90930.1 hypothetical protein BG52_11870 [Paenibacillus darwinianus]